LGIPVHERAARILGEPDSQPTETHHILVDLFSQPENLRIVTTNWVFTVLCGRRLARPSEVPRHSDRVPTSETRASRLPSLRSAAAPPLTLGFGRGREVLSRRGEQRRSERNWGAWR
jgi:hypothetical protein